MLPIADRNRADLDHGGLRGGHGTTITITLPTDKSGRASLPLWTTAEPSAG